MSQFGTNLARIDAHAASIDLVAKCFKSNKISIFIIWLGLTRLRPASTWLKILKSNKMMFDIDLGPNWLKLTRLRSVSTW